MGPLAALARRVEVRFTRLNSDKARSSWRLGMATL